MDAEDKDSDNGVALMSRKTDDARPDIEEQYSRKTLINNIDEKLKEYRTWYPFPLFHCHRSEAQNAN